MILKIKNFLGLVSMGVKLYKGGRIKKGAEMDIKMIGGMKVLAGCRRSRSGLHKILVATTDQQFLEKWQNLPAMKELPIGWERKKWGKEVVLGRICSNGWHTSWNGDIVPDKEKHLEMWVDASLVEPEKRNCRNRICPDCLYKLHVGRKKK